MTGPPVVISYIIPGSRKKFKLSTNKFLDSLRASGYWAGPPHKLVNSGRAHPKKNKKILVRVALYVGEISSYIVHTIDIP